MTTNRKDVPFSRKKAEKQLNELMENVRKYNRNPLHPFMFTQIVIFGSYVNNPKKMMLGDLDVGFKIEKRYHGKAWKACLELGYDEAVCDFTSLARLRDDEEHVCEEYALKCLKRQDNNHLSAFISLHRIADRPDKGENPYIFRDKIMRMDVGKIEKWTDADVIKEAELAWCDEI